MNTYRLVGVCRCPVDESMDVYTITVESGEMIPVEELLAVAQALGSERLFQEDYTDEFAKRLDRSCEITVKGRHSDVDTTTRVET